MKYMYNSLWFLYGVVMSVIGVVFFIPVLLLNTIAKILCALVVVMLFSGLLALSVLFGGNAQQLRQIRDSGISMINTL